jgi:hypothetical protein
MMQVRTKVRCLFVASVAALIGAAAAVACSDSSFQPLAYGAEPWAPPEGWAPDACATGYYVAIESCEGCTGISYALCDGTKFTECVCGSPFTAGATCPQTLPCSTTDFPPHNWAEFTDYTGPGWAGLDSGLDGD